MSISFIWYQFSQVILLCQLCLVTRIITVCYHAALTNTGHVYTEHTLLITTELNSTANNIQTDFHDGDLQMPPKKWFNSSEKVI